MARGDSIIRVSILGDAKKLIAATKDADKAVGGMLSSTAKLAGGFLIGTKAIDFAFDTIQGGLEKADKFHDALDEISGTVSPEFAKRIEDVAFDMTSIGLSADEVASMAASFANLATSAGATAGTLSEVTPDLLAIATAVAATTGKTVDEVIEDIGKAVKGNTRPVEEYGITIDKALSPDETILSILDQLKTKFPDVKSATDDLAGAQENLGAKWDNFTIKLGEALEGPLTSVVDFFITMIDRDIPRMMDVLGDLGDKFGIFGEDAIRPIDAIADALRTVTNLLGEIGRTINQPGGPFGTGLSEREVTFAQRREAERNGTSTRP